MNTYVRQLFSDSLDTDKLSLDTGLDTGSESTVQQQFCSQCEISSIIAQAEITGQLPVLPEGVLRYIDATNSPRDLQHLYTMYHRAQSDIDHVLSLIPAEDRSRLHSSDDVINYLSSVQLQTIAPTQHETAQPETP